MGFALPFLFTFFVLDSIHQIITIKISYGSHAWACMAIYASPTPSLHFALWDRLATLRDSIQLLWVLLGDFNEVFLPLKVSSGSFCSSYASTFALMMDRYRIMDLSLVDSRFTWVHSCENGCKICKRLDRGVGDYDWRSSFPDVMVEVPRRFHSYYYLLLLHCGFSPSSSRNCPFRYQAMKLTLSSLRSMEFSLSWGG